MKFISLKIIAHLIVILTVIITISGCRGSLPEGNLDREINSKYDDFAPILVGDNQLLFTSNKACFAGYIDKESKKGEDLFISSFYDNQWQDGKIFPTDYPTSGLNEGVVSILKSGEIVVGRAYDEKGFGGSDLYSGKYNSATREIENLKNLGQNINTKYWEAHPALLGNGNVLIFSSDRPGGTGGVDLLISYKEGNTWSKPKSLGKKFNTPGDEYSPFVYMAEDTILFFASNGRNDSFGELDIYYTYHKCGAGYDESGWYDVQHFNENINTTENEAFPFIDKDKKLYFASEQKGGLGGYDLYAKTVKIEPPCISLQITLIDDTDNKPINFEANITLSNTKTSERLTQTTKIPESKTEFRNICNGDYRLTITSEKYQEVNNIQKITLCNRDLVIKLVPQSQMISGVVIDSISGKPILMQAKIEYYKDGVIKYSSESSLPASDYTISDIMPGEYDVKISFPNAPLVNPNEIIRYWTKWEKVSVSLTNEQIVHQVVPFEYPLESVAYFVTGYYRINTQKNLRELENLLKGKLENCTYIEIPESKNKYYEDYRKRAPGIEKNLDEMIRSLDEKTFTLMLSEQGIDSKLEIRIWGFADPREILGNYVEGSVVHPNINVQKGAVMNNQVLSELRAFYTMKNIENLLNQKSEKYKLVKDRVKLVIEGKNVDTTPNKPYELRRHVRIFFLER